MGVTETLTAREAELLCQTAEDLQARLAAEEARSHEAEQRAERIAGDMELLEKELRAKRRQVQTLARDRNAERTHDPDGKLVNVVWDYYRERTGHTKMTLDGARFDLIKAALKLYGDQEDPVAILKRAINGAAAFPFVVERERRPTGKRKERFDDIGLVLRNAKKIEDFCELAERAEEDEPAASDRQTPTGDARTQVHRHDPTPLERAIETLRREYGVDAVWEVWNRQSALPLVDEYWSPCPRHPGSATLRIRHKLWGRVALGSREAPEFACLQGCRHEDIADAIRTLEAAQEQRSEAVVIPLRPEDRKAA